MACDASSAHLMDKLLSPSITIVLLKGLITTLMINLLLIIKF